MRNFITGAFGGLIAAISCSASIAFADDYSALTGESGKSWRYVQVEVDGNPSDMSRHADKRHIYYPDGSVIMQSHTGRNEGHWADEGNSTLNISDGAYLIVDYHVLNLTPSSFAYTYTYQGHKVVEAMVPSNEEVEPRKAVEDSAQSGSADVDALLTKYESLVTEFLSALENGKADPSELSRANQLRVQAEQMERTLDGASLDEAQSSRRAQIGDRMVKGMMAALQP